jgi:CBS domain-containing protein
LSLFGSLSHDRACRRQIGRLSWIKAAGAVRCQPDAIQEVAMTERHMSEIVRHQPVTLPETATVQQACEEMHRRRIGAIMVVDDQDRLTGIFTGRDAVRLLAGGHAPAHAHLAKAMTRDPAHMPPTLTAIEALRLMHDGGFRHVPVCDHGRVVGIVSVGDFRAQEHARLDEETGIWERI